MSNVLASTYSDYQQASCQWLDSIPQHWIECRIKQIVSTPVTDGPHETPKFEDDGVPFLSAESVKNLKLDFARKRGFISPELHRQYSKKYIPRRGDIYMVKSGATTGALAIVETDDEFNIWSPLAAIRCRKDICFDRFVFYTMQSEFFQRSIELSWSFGTQQNIGMGVIENLFIARPPLDEQKQIALFLDYETAKIDALIEKQQQLIALLGEKRQAVISHAVTKGLNPDAPMRDSGIEWLGEVPEHWTVSQPKHFTTKIIDGPHHTPTYVDEGIPFVTVKNLTSSNGICLEDTKRITEDDHRQFLKRANPEIGDLLITKDGTLGVTRVVETSDEFSIFVSVALIKLDRSRVNPFFMRASLESSATWAQFSVKAAGAALKHIVLSTIGNVFIPLPSLDEQNEIANDISKRCEILDDLIGKAEDQVELLQERRTALISAAVTGKIDVRGWKPPSSLGGQETEMEVA